MATTTLGERLRAIREAAGYGEPRHAAEFARKVGIKPSSLHNLENGRTKTIGGKSLSGYLSLGANLEFITLGRGVPLVDKHIENQLDRQTLLAIFDEISDDQKDNLLSIAKAIRRTEPGASATDPFRIDAPKAKKPGSGEGTQ